MPDLNDITSRYAAGMAAAADAYADLLGLALKSQQPSQPTDPGPTDPDPQPSTKLFAKARWLNEPIPVNPKLDPQSAAWSKLLAAGGHVGNDGDYGNTLLVVRPGDTGISRATCQLQNNWGGKSLPNVAWRSGLTLAAGGDKGAAIVDWVTGMATNLWQANQSGGKWSAAAGSQLPIDGDGIERGGWTSTGSCLARAAALITKEDVAAGEIRHALFFSSTQVVKGTFRYPANKTDGKGGGPIPEGTRVQLDPAADISGLPPFLRMVAKALQVYGGYVGDVGGTTMAFACELGAGTSRGGSGYTDLQSIPWGRLRVLDESVTRP